MSKPYFTNLSKCTEDVEDTTNVNIHSKQEKIMHHNPRLSKTLSYVLRYGALLEGLDVFEGGYVDVQELIKLPNFKHFTEEEILYEIEISTTPKKHKRYHTKTHNGRILVRAQYKRIFEKSPYHEGCKVSTLFESCLKHVTTNLNMYDLEDFPDEYLLNSMIMKLKRQKKLNNRSLRVLMVPALSNIDLGADFYVTESTIICICDGTPHLKDLNLQNHGYVMTDHLVVKILKKLQLLESLNLSGCNHLTDQTIHSMCRFGKNLRKIFLPWIPGITEAVVLKLIRVCDKLEYLDVYDMTFTSQGKTQLDGLLRGKSGLKVVLKGLDDQQESGGSKDSSGTSSENEED